MKRLLLIILVLCIIACNGDRKHYVDVQDISPSPFIGYWECIGDNDTIRNLSVRIGERNDSLLIAFYWERQVPFYMTGNPLKDSNGDDIPQICITAPESGNKAVGTIVNQYLSIFQNYPKNEYYPVTFELRSLDTLTFRIDGVVNYWPCSGVLLRKNSENNKFSNETTDLYKENAFVPDTDITQQNNFDVAGIVPSPFIGKWEWEKNDSWQEFGININAEGDSLRLTADGVFFGGTRIQMPICDNDGNPQPQASLFIPKHGNKAEGHFFDTNCTVTLELFSNNTILFKTYEPLGFWPDSAVMVRSGNSSSNF